MSSVPKFGFKNVATIVISLAGVWVELFSKYTSNTCELCVGSSCVYDGTTLKFKSLLFCCVTPPIFVNVTVTFVSTATLAFGISNVILNSSPTFTISGLV